MRHGVDAGLAFGFGAAVAPGPGSLVVDTSLPPGLGTPGIEDVDGSASVPQDAPVTERITTRATKVAASERCSRRGRVVGTVMPWSSLDGCDPCLRSRCDEQTSSVTRAQ